MHTESETCWYFSGEEGTALCNILANNLNKWRMQVRGTIVLNGVSIEPSKLQDRVSYVRTDCEFAPDMSVRQTMLFHAFLREPGSHSRARDTKGRINALIEDLGLAQVRHTPIRDLTVSEKQRLNVACHLLMDADIVVLDEPTRGMDIFDTFFLVEYLRQWAGRGRIVIMTLLPPTYEILTMISKIVLISMGKLMYYGKRREMLPYFAFIEYPCPAYKNPADYYRKKTAKTHPFSHEHHVFVFHSQLTLSLWTTCQQRPWSSPVKGSSKWQRPLREGLSRSAIRGHRQYYLQRSNVQTSSFKSLV